MTSGALPAMLLSCAVGGADSVASMVWSSTMSMLEIAGHLLEPFLGRQAGVVVDVEQRGLGAVGELLATCSA